MYRKKIQKPEVLCLPVVVGVCKINGVRFTTVGTELEPNSGVMNSKSTFDQKKTHICGISTRVDCADPRMCTRPGGFLDACSNTEEQIDAFATLLFGGGGWAGKKKKTKTKKILNTRRFSHRRNKLPVSILEFLFSSIDSFLSSKLV